MPIQFGYLGCGFGHVMPEDTMSDYQLQIDLSAPDPVIFRGTDTYRLYAVVSNPVGVGLAAEVFLYERALVDSQSSEYRDDFLGVCSPLDMSTYPRNEPDPTQTPPYFRKSSVDVLLPGLGVYAEAREELLNQLTRLLGLLYNLNRMQTETVVVTS